MHPPREASLNEVGYAIGSHFLTNHRGAENTEEQKRTMPAAGFA
ncbi:hypothetical protein [Nostoc sp. FACHB-133]|nr:hypothetical protein [Nostoc sp. FACHB-133]